MIVPILHGILSMSRAPITWALIFLNFFVFLSTYPKMKMAHKKVAKVFSNDSFYTIQGKIYAQFIHVHPEQYSPFYLKIAKKALKGDQNSEYLLSGVALKDPIFWSQMEHLHFEGDQVAFTNWQKEILAIKAAQKWNPGQTLGVHNLNNSPMSWLTYQFVHSDFAHFFGNMIFLLFFGGALELVVGGFALLVLYLGSGLFAAQAFIFLTGSSLVPLIGASGAISGVLAFVCVIYGSRPIRFFWLVGFSRGYMGFIYLPAWVALLMWGLSDFAGYISEVQEVSGVAYGAHLGGEFIGATMAVAVKLMRWRRTPLVPAYSSNTSPSKYTREFF